MMKPPYHPWIVLRSAVFDGLHMVWLLGYLLMLSILMSTGFHAGPALARALARITRVVLWLLKYVVRLDCRIEGWENLPKTGSFLLVSNHQSPWETMIFFLLRPTVVYVIKKELTGVPIWGWAAKMHRTIVVDRSGGSTAMRRMYKEAKQAIDEGLPIAIFPEGTRTAPGVRAPFQPGVASLFSEGIPIIPIAHNSGLFYGRRLIGTKYPGAITLSILPPMTCSNNRKRDLKVLEERIYQEKTRLEREAHTHYPWLP